jgi:hypothetical protein
MYLIDTVVLSKLRKRQRDADTPRFDVAALERAVVLRHAKDVVDEIRRIDALAPGEASILCDRKHDHGRFAPLGYGLRSALDRFR